MRKMRAMKAPTDQIPMRSQDPTARASNAQTSARVAPQERRARHLLLVFSTRLILGGIFIFASLDKVIHPLGFAKSINYYQILPDPLINLAAIILPWLELILGTLLLFGIWLPGTIVLTDLLLVTFSAVLVFNLARGLNVDCGCFSTTPTENPATYWYVFRDAVFLLLGGYLFFAFFIKPSPRLANASGG